MPARALAFSLSPLPPSTPTKKPASAAAAPDAAPAPPGQDARAPADDAASPAPWPQDDDLRPEERRLRLFDLDKRFGPCIGMTRTARWQRAFELGLNPPPHVLDDLRSAPPGQQREACLWEGRV